MSPAALPANQWSHLAFTYNGATMRLYVNGVEVADQPQTGDGVTANRVEDRWQPVWGEWFAGLIDEVRVYNRALTPASSHRHEHPDQSAGPRRHQAPSVPAGLTATGGLGQVRWAGRRPRTTSV